MWPWGHAAVGYLLYASFVRLYHRKLPSEAATVALAIATQLPDLTDKPLAYSFVLPEGRSLAHSVLFAVPLCALVWYFVDQEDWYVREAFVVGYASHLLADSYGALLAGRFSRASFLLWPILPSPDYPTESFAGHWAKLVGTLSSVTVDGVVAGQVPAVVWQALLAVGIALLWVLDGMPGVRYVFAWVRNRS
jgi:hypothetical protein